MRIIWTLLKVVIGLAIAIPVAMFLLATTLGVLGAMIGLAFVALKFAIFALIAIGAFKLVSRLFRGSSSADRPALKPAAPPADPHYDAAMRELDLHLGERGRG